METLRYVLLANALLMVVSVAFYVLLRHETHFRVNRLVLWAGLVLTLVMPLLRLPDWRPRPVRTVMQRTAQVIVPRLLPAKPTMQPGVTITYPNGRTYPFIPARQLANREWSWPNGLAAIYLTGVLALLTWLGIRLFALQRLIRRSPHDHYDDFTLVRTGQPTAPFSFFRWMVMNPADHAPDELDQILRHERVHIRERHSLDILGAEMVCVFFWFNPAAYLFRKLVRQALEFRADRAVLDEGIDAVAYQYNLVRVSLGADSWALTNSFSTTHLKTRIAMLNRTASSKTAWLTYLTFTLTLVAAVVAFGRTDTRALIPYIPTSIRTPRETVTTIVGLTIPFAPEPRPDSTQKADPNVAKTDGREDRTAPTGEKIILDSAAFRPKIDTVTYSPSRYIVYQNGFLYWIVTPRTTFDDLNLMKQVMSRHNFIMQINEVRYDPLYAYIDRVNVTVVRPTKGMTRVDDFKEDWKPISTVAGFVGLRPENGLSGTGSFSNLSAEFPAELRRIAEIDEASVAQFIRDHRLDYLVEVGEHQFGKFGGGSSSYNKEFFQKQPTNKIGLNVQPDGSLLISSELTDVPVYVNNQPATHESVRSLTVSRLHSLIRKEKYDPVRKISNPSALLIYVTD